VRENSGFGRCISSLKGHVGPLTSKDVLSDSSGAYPQLNYNAVAQGYSCDLVAKYLYSVGVKDMLVNIGEIFCDGKNPSGQPWTVGIDRPVDGNNELGAQLQGVFKVPEGPHGVVTSGNYRKFYIKDGKKYAHTIDPRTGYPVSHSLLSATVIAPDAMLADAYATYCMVVGLEESKALFAGRTDMEACLVYDEDGVFKTWCTPGFILEK
jgi:thiamine biosynthesis lipoprotein